MYNFDQKTINFVKHYLVISIIVAALSLISFYTSFDGLARAFFGDISRMPVKQAHGIVFVGFITFALQLMIVYAAFLLVYIDSFMLRFGWFVIYLLAISINVFFSYNFYYGFLKADEFAKKDFIYQLNTVQKSFQELQENIDILSDKIITLSKYSNDIATKEKRKGGTCGTVDISIKKAVKHYRNEEAKLFGSFVTHIDTLREKVTKDIVTVQAIINNGYTVGDDIYALQNKINENIEKSNLYKEDETLINIQIAINQHTGHNRNNIVVTGTDGIYSILDCPDKNFEEQAISIKDNIRELHKIDQLAVFNPKAEKQLLFRTLSILVDSPALLKAFLLSEEEKTAFYDSHNSTIADLTPLTIGLFLNIAIFVVIFMDMLARKFKNKPKKQKTKATLHRGDTFESVIPADAGIQEVPDGKLSPLPKSEAEINTMIQSQAPSTKKDSALTQKQKDKALAQTQTSVPKNKGSEKKQSVKVPKTTTDKKTKLNNTHCV